MSLNIITPMKEIVKNYDALIFDIWGVIYEGFEPFEGAIDFLNQMILDNKQIVFLSNTPRPSDLIKKRFSSWKLMNSENVNFYTSGEQIRQQFIDWDDHIFKNLGKNFYYLGEDRNKDLLEGLEVKGIQNIEDADFLLLSLYMDEGEDLSYYDELFKQAIDLNIPAICANPDVEINYNNKIRYCSGAFAARYSNFGGNVYYYGKPEVDIFNIVFNKYLSKYENKKILMVGDTIETDIKGATKVGIDSALVLTGNGNKIAKRINNNEQDIFENSQPKPTWISYGLGL
jgi:HAD superfamily hydrolase (TIGR01459 family)